MLLPHALRWGRSGKGCGGEMKEEVYKSFASKATRFILAMTKIANFSGWNHLINQPVLELLALPASS